MNTLCPNCGHLEKDGVPLCSNCGHSLRSEKEVGGLPTHRLSGHFAAPEASGEDAALSFLLLHAKQILPLFGKGEFILGRVSEGQAILPDIDLEPYMAYEAGVSRLHALVKVAEHGGITLMDLGSSNGTMVNKQQLAPNKEHPLQHKDLIRLGRLDMQALLLED